MKTPIAIVLLLLAFMFTVELEAQDRVVSFHHYSTNEGVANNNINCFTQDNWGYMWIGTANGLSCFDSYTFKNYLAGRDDRNGLVSSNIQSLLCDTANNIWIGTASGGLSVLNRKTGVMYAYHLLTHNARFNSVKALVKLKDGRIVLGTDKGLYVAQGGVTRLSFVSVSHLMLADQTLPDVNINCIDLDGEGRMWIGTESGSLFMLTPKGDSLFSIIDFTAQQKLMQDKVLAGIQDVHITKENELWLATWGQGLQIIDLNNDDLDDAVAHRTFFLNDEVAIATAISSFGSIVYATTWNHGVVVYDYQLDTTLFWRNNMVRHPGLVTNDLFSIFTDKDGNVWIGASRFGGISVYTWKSRMVEHYELGEIVQSPVDRNRIYALEKDGSGNVYIGGVGGMFAFHDKGLKFENIAFPLSAEEVAQFKVLCVQYDKIRDEVWIGCDGFGMYNYKPHSKVFRHYEFKEGKLDGLSNNSVQEIFVGSDRNVWIGSWGGGLDMLNPETGQFINYPVSFDKTESEVVLDITEDRNETLWLATMGNGLMSFSINEKKMYDHMIVDKYGNIPQNYYFIYNDGHDIWGACLENGLVRYNPETKETDWYNSDRDMTFGHISGIEPAGDTALLINTDKGVYVIKNNGEAQNNYMFTDNLTPMTFWNESSVSDSKNWVYLAGDKGLLRYKPENLKKDTVRPFVQLTRLEVNNQTILSGMRYENGLILKDPIENAEDISLDYSDNSVAFSFSAMDYTNSRHNIYSYQLEGFDTEWNVVPASERKATYTNIPPGKYLFKIKATNSDGVWSPHVTEMKLTIQPPYWQRLWFMFLISTLVFGLIGAFVKFRQRNLAMKNNKLKAEVVKRTAEVTAKNEELKSNNSKLYKQTELLNISNEQIRRQKGLLQHQNKEINDSIGYAKRLQESLLPSPNTIRKFFPESFVLFRPKEAISGDFYWTFSDDSVSVFITADCTGHGIPGAMVSMLGISFFNSIANSGDLLNAGAIVRQIAINFNRTFCSSQSTRNAKDSMDLSVCVFNKDTKEISFSGVFNSLFLVRDGELTEYPADRIPISCENNHYEYTNHRVDYVYGDALYMFSDGFQDQFGGPEGKKFKSRKFRNLLAAIAHESMAHQNKILTEVYANWLFHGNSNKQNEQIDDVLVAGIRITKDIFD